MILEDKDAVWAADKLIEYFGDFNRIDDYFRARKVERIKNLPAPLFGMNLEDDMFQEYDMSPEDMKFKIYDKIQASTFDAMLEKTASFSPDENIVFDKEVIARLVLKHFPDFRRVLNELQRYSTSGEINSGILANIKEMNLKELIDSLREKNFTKMRQWVVGNVDNDPATVYRKIYDELYNVTEKSSIPQAVLTIADYQYKSAFVADQEINLVACLVELMAECEFV